MPVIKSAIKKLRQDKKREKRNDSLKDTVSNAVRSAKKAKTSTTVKKAISVIDKATKKNLLHKNKAARMKSSLAKLAKTTGEKKATPSTTKAKTSKKAPVKKTK